MVDYTSPKTGSGRGIGWLIAGAVVVLVLLYALFAGGGVSTTQDATGVGTVQDTAPAAPVAPETAPPLPDPGPALPQ
ncbi:hypothetical protein [Yoonia sp.]|jgi:hypothetical protein|uniref:hypothetical protein n=1 Tax=Yoonia sp. TaxID=2212373 RepID=UPI0025FA142A|nr:hypothetical protein [Yoonia sp.]